MEPDLIGLTLFDNADLHLTLPVLDTTEAAVDMTDWPFKLQLKFDEFDAAVALDVAVSVQAEGELLLEASKANIAAIWPAGSTKKRFSLVGDLLTKPYNGAYVACIGVVKALAKKGTSTL